MRRAGGRSTGVAASFRSLRAADWSFAWPAPGVGTPGTCTARPSPAGASCAPYTGCGNGLECDLASGTCIVPPIVPLGSACDPTKLQICAAGSCIGGTCVASAAEGASCETGGPPCAYPLLCVNKTCAYLKTQDKCGNALLDGG